MKGLKMSRNNSLWIICTFVSILIQEGLMDKPLGQKIVRALDEGYENAGK